MISAIEAKKLSQNLETLLERCDISIKNACCEGKCWTIIHSHDMPSEVVSAVREQLLKLQYSVTFRPDDKGFMNLYVKWGHIKEE